MRLVRVKLHRHLTHRLDKRRGTLGDVWFKNDGCKAPICRPAKTQALPRLRAVGHQTERVAPRVDEFHRGANDFGSHRSQQQRLVGNVAPERAAREVIVQPDLALGPVFPEHAVQKAGQSIGPAKPKGLSDHHRVDVVPLDGGMDSHAAIRVPTRNDGAGLDRILMMGCVVERAVGCDGSPGQRRICIALARPTGTDSRTLDAFQPRFGIGKDHNRRRTGVDLKANRRHAIPRSLQGISDHQGNNLTGVVDPRRLQRQPGARL